MRKNSFSMILITVLTLLTFTTSTAFPAHVVKAIEQDRRTAPPGTLIVVRLAETVSTAQNRPGDTIRATLVDPVFNYGKEVFPAGTEVLGRVKNVQRPDRGQRNGEMEIVFDRIIGTDGREVSIVANLEGASKFTQDSWKRRLFTMAIAVGAGILVSKIFGGSVLRGLLIGSAAGTGYVLYNEGDDVTLPAGTTINLVLEETVTVNYEFPESKQNQEQKYGEIDEALEPADTSESNTNIVAGKMTSGPVVKVLLKSGKAQDGNFTGISEAGKFLIRHEYGTLEIPLADVSELIFDETVGVKVSKGENDTVLLKNGNILSGYLMGFSAGKLVISSDYGEMRIPLKDAARLILRK